MESSKKLIILDCENCYNPRIVSIFNKHPEYEYKLVCGEHQKLDTSRHFVPMSIVRTKTHGKNAADFLIVTISALRLANSNSSVAIVSDDKGFDSSVLYLRSIGYKIHRFGSRYVENNFSFKWLSTETIENCTSSYSSKERKQALELSAESLLREQRLHSIRGYTPDTRKLAYKDVQKKYHKNFGNYLEKLVNISERNKAIRKKPVSNTKKLKKHEKRPYLMECATTLLEYKHSGISIEAILSRFDTIDVKADSKIVLKELVKDGIVCVVYRPKTNIFQVYWSSTTVKNYITFLK